MRRYAPTQKIGDEDLSILVVCAVRYAIGRRTYLPSTLCDIIRRLTLTDDTRGLLCRTISASEERNDLGDACDAAAWWSLREWLKGKGPSAGRDPSEGEKT